MKRRFIPPYAESSPVIYHVITRVVDRNFVLQQQERNKMVELIRKYEFFSGVKVNSYCVMSNHLHLIIEVPAKVKGASIEMSDEELLERLRVLYSPEYFNECKWMLKNLREGAGQSHVAAEEYKAKFTRRMCDLSEFMKGVKQSFSRWFNKKHERTGTLWESRFTSLVIEDGVAARAVSTYIDLNPVRAHIVEKPEDYRWSSYGDAMKPWSDKNRELSRAGICRVLQKHSETGGQFSEDKSMWNWENGVADRYRMMLFSDGAEVFADNPATGKIAVRIRDGFKRSDVEKVLAKGGKLSFGEALRCRVRYMSDGVAIGSRQFVDELFQLSKDRFGAKRKTGARSMREVRWKKEDTRLYTLRQLKKNVVQ